MDHENILWCLDHPLLQRRRIVKQACLSERESALLYFQGRVQDVAFAGGLDLTARHMLEELQDSLLCW